MLAFFVLDAQTGEQIPASVRPATREDLRKTKDWQTNWMSKAAAAMPNKVALYAEKTDLLLGLMSYELRKDALAVSIVYIESARHSNANLLHETGGKKSFLGIARALFAYAAYISAEQGFDGVLIFRAKTTELLRYYMREFGARQVGAYDPFQLVIWEDAAEKLMAPYRRETHEKSINGNG